MCEYFSIRCDVSCVYLELLIHPDPCTILDLLIHPDPYTCACPNAAEGCRIHLRVTSHPNTYHTPAHVPTQPKAAVYICELHLRCFRALRRFYLEAMHTGSDGWDAFFYFSTIYRVVSWGVWAAWVSDWGNCLVSIQLVSKCVSIYIFVSEWICE